MFLLIFLLFSVSCPWISQGLRTNASYFYSQQGFPLVLAHRGASGFLPESTLPAFRVAMAMDADFLEFDVVLTKDQELLVMHDPFLSRVTNIADFPEFSDRKSQRVVENQILTDFFVVY